jgi:uncharacterized membrane protein
MVFLSIRVLHMLLAAVWLGSTVFVSLLLLPAVADAGPAGGAVMAALGRRGLVTIMAILSGVTVLTGIWLLWHFTNGFDPAISRGHASMAFSIGGAAGLVAAIIEGSVVGRSAKQLMALAAQSASLADDAARAAAAPKLAAIRQRLVSSSRIVLVLLVGALVLMSIGHYV